MVFEMMSIIGGLVPAMFAESDMFPSFGLVIR